uniref:Uncharacterized protein n=1 Tax=Globisporangium ultimum (strain ATCC 200006 / CBS 805.95 / DAOM BR144) TaxID=431595 RepID=K3X0H0_GLOUD
MSELPRAHLDEPEQRADAIQPRSATSAPAPALLPPKFYFTPGADVVVLREALVLELFAAPRGQKHKLIDEFGERVCAALNASIIARSAYERFLLLVRTFEKNDKVHKKNSGTYSQYLETQKLLNEVCDRIEACEAQKPKKPAANAKSQGGRQADKNGASRTLLSGREALKRRKVDGNGAPSRVSSTEAQFCDAGRRARSSRRQPNGGDTLSRHFDNKIARLRVRSAGKDLDMRKRNWEAELALRKQENEIHRREIRRRREEVKIALLKAEIERKMLDRTQEWEAAVAHRRDENESYR